jgi:hypothetical protein
MFSNISGVHLGRPGLGDKMLDFALQRGMPLTAISASPPPTESAQSKQLCSAQYATNHTSYDSIMSLDPELQQASNMEDSIFEKMEHKSSFSLSDSAFFCVDSLHEPTKFRPLLSFSITSIHSPLKDDDTMISISYHAYLSSLAVEFSFPDVW